MWKFLLGGVTDLAKGWMQHKANKQAAKHERELKHITGEQEWDIVQAENSGRSWKDEWFTILLSIPLILAFFPGCVNAVREGFMVLDTMPDWYKYLLGVAVAASFGYRKIADAIKGKGQ